MKKRLLAGMLSMTMMMAMVLPVSADNMEVKYVKANSFTLTIPTNVTLSDSTGSTANIAATAMDIEPTKTLNVKVKSGISGGSVTLTRANDTTTTTTTSTVSLTSGGTAIADDATVASFTGINTTPTNGTLYFSQLATDLKAGTYTGTIVFEMIVE